MKIAIDIREIFGPRAGKGEYTFRILKGLLRLDQENKYFLYSKKHTQTKRQNVRLRAINLPGLIWHLTVWLDLKLRVRPDVYLSPTSYIVPALGVKNSVIIVPDLVSFLFPGEHNKKAVWLERMFLKAALKKSERIITISRATKHDLLARFELSEKKVAKVYLGVHSRFREIKREDSRLIKIRKKYNLPEKFILFVGVLSPRKNLVRLLRAYHKMTLRDFGLVIVGRKGWYYQNIFYEVRKLGLEDRVCFLDYLREEDLPFVYNLASVFVFPSLYEGFGFPPLEAMACGTPVIASRASSLPEVVGKAGLLVDPKKVSEISEAMKRILTNKGLRDKLIRLGFLQAKKFSWNKTVRETLRIMQSLKP